MPWYKTGTVSVTQNSNAVIGTGTAFIANSRVGDGFRGPDGRWYEVTNIASDTAMSIAPPYQGPTSADGAYALAPMQGYVKDSADALRALVNQFGTQLAALTDTDGLPEGATNKYFSDARVRTTLLQGLVITDGAPVAATDTVLASLGKLQAQVTSRLPLTGGKLTGAMNDATPAALASAATVDIGAAASNVITISGTTAITGLGTIAAGARRTVRFLGSLVLAHNPTSLILPTGASITTAVNDTAEFLSLGAGNWFCIDYARSNGKAVAFAFDRSSIVGAVSQSGGVPGGALIEQSSNANGRYVKFADGTMICHRRLPLTIAVNIAAGNMFYSGGIAATAMASTFVGELPTVTSTLEDSAGISWIAEGGAPSLSNFPPLYIVCPFSVGSRSYTASLIAVGRWY